MIPLVGDINGNTLVSVTQTFHYDTIPLKVRLSQLHQVSKPS